jgi:hypothetical protein
MKTGLVITALVLALSSCASRAPTRSVYRETQFASRLEYLRFCQHFELQTYRCPD